MKRALLVGIGNYPGSRSDLGSCIKDIEQWSSLLMQRFDFSRENIRLLTNERATKEEVKKRLEWLTTNVTYGDTLVFLYSGHGTTFTERDEIGHLDEAKDEALILYGYGWENMLIDDELSEIFSNISMNVNLTVICDTCFSGGMSDSITTNETPTRSLTSKHLSLPPDLEHRNDPKSPKRVFGCCLSKEEAAQASVSSDFSGPKSLLLAACRENEKAAAGSAETNGLSVFSYYATQVLRYSDTVLTARELIDRVAQDIANAGYSQIPQLKGRKDLFDKPIFG